MYTAAELNLGDRVWSEVIKDSFITLPGTGGHSGTNAFKIMCPHFGKIMRVFMAVVQRGCDQLMDVLLMVWW